MCMIIQLFTHTYCTQLEAESDGSAIVNTCYLKTNFRQSRQYSIIFGRGPWLGEKQLYCSEAFP